MARIGAEAKEKKQKQNKEIFRGLTFPERTASSNASGIDPADVFPYSARFVIT